MAEEPRSAGVSELPDFDYPPVVEVALSVSFDPLPRVTAADLGALWQLHYRNRGFPFTADQPPLRVLPEQFPASAVPALRVELTPIAPTPRMWLTNENGTQLVQVQRDWFARNWRKMETEEEYPRYPAIRRSFDEDLSHFQSFLESEDLGPMVPRHAEVTYVNQIFLGGGVERVDQVLNIASPEWHRTFLPSPEFTRLSAQFVIPAGDRTPLGRLYVAAEPAFRASDGAPMLLVTLTARGNLPREGLKGLSDFLDIGHRWVVLGFVDVTTEQMHEVWRLKHGDR
jgi:uncharacterized protein (TIGR04255 family)